MSLIDMKDLRRVQKKLNGLIWCVYTAYAELQVLYTADYIHLYTHIFTRHSAM